MKAMQVNKEKKKLIRLTQGMFVEVDETDIVKLSQYKWYAKKNTSKREDGGKYYAARSKRVDGKAITIYMHRVITNCPDNKEVDHKNDDGLCNKRENLIICTRKEHTKRAYEYLTTK